MSGQACLPVKAPVSVFVLTYNEELNIAECLGNLQWAAEVFVVDSLSMDRTSEIAQEWGAKVVHHPFEGWSKQANWALDNLPFAHDWVMMVDADERIPQALANEIREVVSRDGDGCSAFYVSFRLFFLGRWLKHGGLYPAWVTRLLKRGDARWEVRPVNPHVILDGPSGYLTQPYDHVDRRPLSVWLAKHIGYADLEAEEYLREKSGEAFESSLLPSLRGTQAQRKRWIKLRVWNRLPLLVRPFLFFFRNYFLKGGFLDGRQGFIYHVLWSFWVRFLIDVKIVERMASGDRPAGPAAPQNDGVEAERPRSKEAVAP